MVVRISFDVLQIMNKYAHLPLLRYIAGINISEELTRSGVWQSLPGRQCHHKKKHTKMIKRKQIKKDFNPDGIDMKIDQTCGTKEEEEK